MTRRINRFHHSWLGAFRQSPLGARGYNWLYVGGHFLRAGGETGQIVRRIARWNGHWNRVGEGFGTDDPNHDDYVHKNGLAFVSNGPNGALRLFITGHLTNAGSVTLNHCATWDGANYDDANWDAGTYPAVVRTAIYPWRGGIVVASPSTYFQDRYRIWHEFTGGQAPYGTNAWFDWDGDLLSGGSTSQEITPLYNYVAPDTNRPWDGTWHGDYGLNLWGESVMAFAVAPWSGNMLCGGSIEEWKGHAIMQWSVVPGENNDEPFWHGFGYPDPDEMDQGGLDGVVNDMVIWNDRLVAVGEFLGPRDGSVILNNIGWYNSGMNTWEPIGGGLPASINAATVWDGKLVVGGRFSKDVHGGTCTGVAMIDSFNGTWDNMDGGTYSPPPYESNLVVNALATLPR